MVRVDLARAGADEIDGSAHTYSLGHGHGDVIDGRGGDDAIFEVDGPSRIAGGAGDDHLTGIVAGGRLRCGAGRDVLEETGFRLLVPADCEWVRTQDSATRG